MTNKRMDWLFEGTFDDALADALGRLAEIRNDGCFPATLSVEWNGSPLLFACEIAYEEIVDQTRPRVEKWEAMP